MGNGDLTFGVRMTFDGKSAAAGIGENRAEMDKLGQSTLTAAASAEKLNSAQQFQSKWFADSSKTVREHSAAVTETAGNVSKLLDRYDPLGAKLRLLQADFKALDAAAGSGKVSANDDTRLHAAYTKIQQEINVAKGAASGFGTAANDAFGAAAAAAEKSMFATAGAKRELIVLGHEAVSGNFSRMPGSMMVLAERVGLTAAAFNPLTVGIIAATVVTAGFAFAAHQGAEEMHVMDRALASTSNFAGMTRGDLRTLAAEMTYFGNTTIGQAKDIVTQMAASGQIGASAFAGAANVVARYAQITGQSAEEATPKLIKLFSDPLRGAEELNRSMHFLSIADMDRIQTLTEMGLVEEAQRVLVDRMTEQLPKHAENVGYVTQSYRNWKSAISGVADAIEGVGRDNTVEEKLKKNASYIVALQNTPNANQSALKGAIAEQMRLMDQYKSEQITKTKDAEAAEANRSNNEIAGLARSSSLLAQKYKIKAEIARLDSQEYKDAIAKSGADSSKLEAFRKDAIVQKQRQLAQIGAPKKEHTPHVAGVDADFRAALDAQNEAYKSGAMSIEAYRDRVAALIATKTELGRKIAKEDEPFSLNKALDEANKDLDKRRSEISKAGAENSQRLLEETQKNNIALIQDDRTRALAQFDDAKQAWQDKVEVERSGLALSAEGSAGREQAAKHLAETEVAYAQWTQSEIAKINQQTLAADDFWGGASKAAADYQQSAMNVAKNSKDFFSRSFKSMEDAVTNFAMTGKLQLRDFANMAIQEFYRISLARPLVGALSGAFQGAMGGASGWFGGQVSTSSTYGTNLFSQQTTQLAAQTAGMHSGGIVGQDSTFFRSAPISLWAGAPRFHTGGIIGPGERAIIAEDGEEMLTRNDPRHRYNLSNSSASDSSGPITLIFSPTIQIDAPNATAGTAQTITAAVNQAMVQSRASLMAELASGGSFAVATGRRKKR